MRRNSHKKNMIAIIVLIGIICMISISYATLTKTLTTKFSKITQTPLNYDVIATSAAVIHDPQGNYQNCGTITVTNDYQITITGVKMFPESSCIYRVKIKNNSGSGLKAKLTSIESIYPTGLSSCSGSPYYFGCDIPGSNTGRIRYAISQDVDFSNYLSTGVIVADNTVLTLFIRINNTATEIVEQGTANGGGFKLTFTAQ